MTLFDTGPVKKFCIVYCGDDRCNCDKNPKYRYLRPNTMTEYIELDVLIKSVTDKAVLVEYELDDVWIPRSCIEDDMRDITLTDNETTLRVAAWFVKKKGLTY